MIDDVDHRAWGPRPRDLRQGPFRIPDARELGRRLAALRARCGLSVGDVADVAGVWHSQIEEFEETGLASAETLLWLIEILCRDDGLVDAFRHPILPDRQDSPSGLGAAGNVLPFRTADGRK